MDKLELQTEGELAQGGEAIAKAADGRVVFVSGAAPRERVQAEVILDKKTFLKAKTVAVLEPSADRVAPQCPHFGVCGGCALQHVGIEAQRRSKTRALVEGLRRLAGIEPERYTLLPTWGGPAYGYRSRARFGLGKSGKLGYRKGQSNDVVPIEVCPILSPPLTKALAALRNVLANQPVKIRELVEITVVANGTEARVSLPRALAKEAEVLTLHGLRSGELPANDGHPKLTLSPAVFAQANFDGNKTLVSELASWAGEGLGEVLELYSGSGNFSRVLALVAKRVLALESDRQAAGLARSALPSHVEARPKAVEDELKKLVEAKASFDLVVLDPPRTGLSPEVRESLGALFVKRMIYVSCDPPTFARDVGVLAGMGWQLARVKGFDLYPQTAHFEVLAELTRPG